MAWAVFDLQEGACSSNASYTAPPELMCPSLLAKPQYCAPLTAITDGALNGTISDGSPANGSYAPATLCVWTISSPNAPYLSVRFSRLDTEARYDVVAFEDTDGPLDRFSGKLEDTVLETDTGAWPSGGWSWAAGGLGGWAGLGRLGRLGRLARLGWGVGKLQRRLCGRCAHSRARHLTAPPHRRAAGYLKITFTADGDIQGSGFSLDWQARASPDVPVPTCSPAEKLVLAVLRTRQFASENSWVAAAAAAAAAAA